MKFLRLKDDKEEGFNLANKTNTSFFPKNKKKRIRSIFNSFDFDEVKGQMKNLNEIVTTGRDKYTFSNTFKVTFSNINKVKKENVEASIFTLEKDEKHFSTISKKQLENSNNNL